MFRLIMVFSFCLSVFACSQFKTSEKNNEIELMDEYIETQKTKLPIKNYESTKWVNIYREGNKMVYVYQLDGVMLQGVQINVMKDKFNSAERKEKFCNMIENTIKSPIVLESMLQDANGELIVSASFKSEDCKN